jgi:hypothetical protein
MWAPTWSSGQADVGTSGHHLGKLMWAHLGTFGQADVGTSGHDLHHLDYLMWIPFQKDSKKGNRWQPFDF